MLAYEGQLIMNGFYPGSEGLIDWHWLRTKEITTYCPNSRTRPRLEATLRLIQQGHLKVKELVTHEFGIQNAEKAYGMLLDGSATFLGIIINWN
jgi:threonine dehydrogenase-like Zn-dependent dehydrogenase